MKKFVLTCFVLVIVTALATVAFVGLLDANRQNAKLTSDLTDLQEQYSDLQTKYYELWGNYSTLEWKYSCILLQSPYLVPNPASSGVTNSSYLSRYEALKDLYVNLKETYDQYVADYQKLRSLTDQRFLWGNAAKSFIVPFDPDVVNLVHNITGKVANTSDSIIWGDIKALYDWVNNNIEYHEDGLYPVLPYNPAEVETKGLMQNDQMAQFPNETLALRKGDCEDTAVLLCSMVRAYFETNYETECIWITGETAGHVAVMIPFSGDKIVILDPVKDYYSHSTLGDMALNSVSTEIYNWMNIWRPSLGNDVHVYRVFCDYMDDYFNTTEQFTNWMYNR